jgi:tetrahydromethanopterin S-methyltransferase subunit E
MDGAVLAQQVSGEPHLFGWYAGLAIAFAIIVVVVVEVQEVLRLARQIGVQAQMAIQGLEGAYTNTAPLHDLQRTIDFAKTIVADLLATRKALGG